MIAAPTGAAADHSRCEPKIADYGPRLRRRDPGCAIFLLCLTIFLLGPTIFLSSPSKHARPHDRSRYLRKIAAGTRRSGCRHTT